MTVMSMETSFLNWIFLKLCLLHSSVIVMKLHSELSPHLNQKAADICIPTITTIEVDLEKMAAAAVEIIMKKLSQPDYTEGRRVIGGKLIQKNSVLYIGNN